MLRHHLERELITVAELSRRRDDKGSTSFAHVKECRLETGGALTFIQRQPTDEEVRHHEMVGLIAQLDARQRSMPSSSRRWSGRSTARPATRPERSTTWTAR